MKNRITISLCLFLLFLLIPMLQAEAQRNYAVGLKAGTAGIGLEASVSITEKLNGRLAGAYFGYNTDGLITDMDPNITYAASASVLSIGALADYYPFKRLLSLSAGVYYLDFEMDGDGTPAESYTIDRRTFSPERIGRLSAKMNYGSKIAPYAGIGLGNPVSAGSPLTFKLELGAMYTSSPKVQMEGEGMIAPTANQDRKLEDGMSDFNFYPVLNLGLSYRL